MVFMKKEGGDMGEMIVSRQLLVVTRKGRGIRVPTSDYRCMGRKAKGVRAIDLEGNDEVVDSCVLRSGHQNVLLSTSDGLTKKVAIEDIRLQSRAGRGATVMDSNCVVSVMVE